MRAGYAVVPLLLIAAGCVHNKPDTTASDPSIAAKQPAATPSADPATQSPAAEPTAPVPPPPVAKPTPPASPEPVANPAAPSPPEPVVSPAAPTPPVATPTAPPSPQPVGKPTPSAPAPKSAAPTPSQPKPAAPSAAVPPAASKAASPATIQPAATPTLDLNALKEEVRSTSAIGVFTKLTLKNQVDDLLDDFRDYHRGKSKRTQTDLRRAYDLLLMKVLSLLQDKDPRLATSIVSSREAIWDLLADPKKFATVAG